MAGLAKPAKPAKPVPYHGPLLAEILQLAAFCLVVVVIYLYS
jgi:hypothetical protein